MIQDTIPVALNKKKEILRFAEWFLDAMAERCMKECGGSLPAFHYPVFRKFLKYRVKREFRVYEECIRLASVLSELQCSVSETDIDDLIRESIHLDNKLKSDIVLLPVRVHFDYDHILLFRKKRIGKQVDLFKMMQALTLKLALHSQRWDISIILPANWPKLAGGHLNTLAISMRINWNGTGVPGPVKRLL